MSSSKTLSFAQARTQAKELLHGVQSGDQQALQRAVQYFKSFADFRLAHAQLVIARETGFASWAEMKRVVHRLPLSEALPIPAFFRAIEHQDLLLIQTALAESETLASVWRKTEHGYWESALHVAAQVGNIEIARCLIESGAEVYAVRQSGYPPVSDAYDRKQHEMVDFLLSESASRDAGAPPTYGIGIDIVLAARIGWLERVQLHVEKDPLAVYRRGCIGESVLHWPAHNSKVNIVSYLLDHGAGIETDEIGLYGGKPLHWASEHSPEAATLLLQRGANPNSRNLLKNEFEGYTPLHMCARQREECIQCAQLLLNAGADISLSDARGNLALDVAEMNGRRKMADFLRSKN